MGFLSDGILDHLPNTSMRGTSRLGGAGAADQIEGRTSTSSARIVSTAQERVQPNSRVALRAEHSSMSGSMRIAWTKG